MSDLNETVRLINHFGRLNLALEEAGEAAENYHEAWQDAAVYWKDRVAALELEVARLRAAVGPKEDPMDVVHDAMEGDWH